MCVHNTNLRGTQRYPDEQLVRIEKSQRLHRTGAKRKQKGERWPYQAAFNSLVRLEMRRRGIFNAEDSFG